MGRDKLNPYVFYPYIKKIFNIIPKEIKFYIKEDRNFEIKAKKKDLKKKFEEIKNLLKTS
jgi:uncharacterized membrane protein required for colicin V production